ncbi:MAG TPA: enoyl-CoA hydratase-related protein [Acidimicrobiia bacterium]|jgi:enoyl-CoA hydratase/carnithine racemase|nr:enoyl-CoA hydratase-related protein [Acidimicrobiia bacterium]
MEYVSMEVDGAVAMVRLDRPPVNALSEQVALELKEAFISCQDPALRAVVVTGQPHFAAGADIKGFKATFDSGSRERTASTLLDAIDVLDRLEKPTIAAVHGYALGGGCELSLGCDFRYLATDARIGQPEVLLGLIPGAGGTQRLQRVVGFQRAKDIVYTGRQVDAEEALRIGYADKVAPVDEVLDLALSDAAAWAAKATVAIAEAKKALAAGRGVPLEEALAIEQEGFQKTFASEDAVEGVNAFIEKREARFEGR